MSEITDTLQSIAERVRLGLAAKDAAREKAIPLCREAIRLSSQAIRAVHRQEFRQAKELLKSARNLLDEALKVLEAAGLSNIIFLRDAQKELCEGNILLALVTGQALPDPDDPEASADYAAYLNGLGEAAGELRRYLLDGIRKGELSRGEEILSAMDDIYNILVTMDFPDALTGGLRRTTDMVRGVLERTRSDLTLVIRQKDLEEKLNSLERGLK